MKNFLEYQERLQLICKILRDRRKPSTKKKKREYYWDGVEYGLNLALEALTGWEQQQPDTKEVNT